MCMRVHLAHVAVEISDHSPNFLDTPRILTYIHVHRRDIRYKLKPEKIKINCT
jgi:hypothetical protein